MLVKTFLTCVIVFASCTSSPRGGSASSQDMKDSASVAKYETIAIERYKDRIEYVFNESKVFVLCIHSNKPTAKMPESIVSFFVYDLKMNRVILEESIRDGSVRWIDEQRIEIVQKTGTVSKEDQSRVQRYVYDVMTQKKTEIPN